MEQSTYPLESNSNQLIAPRLNRMNNRAIQTNHSPSIHPFLKVRNKETPVYETPVYDTHQRVFHENHQSPHKAMNHVNIESHNIDKIQSISGDINPENHFYKKRDSGRFMVSKSNVNDHVKLLNNTLENNISLSQLGVLNNKQVVTVDNRGKNYPSFQMMDQCDASVLSVNNTNEMYCKVKQT
jgi:hypothetical protein